MNASVANTKPSDAALAVAALIWRGGSGFAPVADFEEAESMGLIERQRAVDRSGHISDFYKLTPDGCTAVAAFIHG
jgi:hypothetical protein